MKSPDVEALERQVEECTRQLERASLARSRFLAASHELRQPLHALGLFVGQLRGHAHEPEQMRVVEQIDAAVSALNNRFNALLDTSTSETGTLGPTNADETSTAPAPTQASLDIARGKLIVVIDDDPLVLEGTCGLLRSWGCSVVSADSGSALASLVDRQRPPDLIISDLHLPQGETGIEAIAAMRKVSGNAIPAFLVSGDTSAEATREARSNGCHLLQKPVDPMALRAILNRMLKKRESTNDRL
jgi:CheY-like chemotaxis protein